MAQKLYSSIGGLSNEVTKMYGSISGLSDNIIKGYCSVNGLSKLFFNGNGKPDKSFWFYYTTINGKIIEYRAIGGFLPPLTNNVVTKTNTGIAFYCTTRDINGSCIITFSTDSNAVAYVDTIQGYSTNPTTGNVIINDETWYYAYEDLRPNATAMDVVPECEIQEASFSSMTPVQIITWIINNRIYVNDFAEEYIAGETYNLVTGGLEKTIRKYLAIYLYKNAGSENPSRIIAYNNVLSHLEDVVSYFLQQTGGRIIELCADTPEGDSWGIRFIAYYGDANLDNVLVEDRTDGYEGYSNCSLDLEVNYSKMAQVDFKTNGTIEYTSRGVSFSDYGYIGIGGYGIDYMNWSNIGLDFEHSTFSSDWNIMSWNGYTEFQGAYIWTDGTDFYYSYNNNQYVLNKSTNTWVAKTWNGYNQLLGDRVWTDGTNIYYSNGTNGQYVLNKATSTWSVKSWNYAISGNDIWECNGNIYCSAGLSSSKQYVLDKANGVWKSKTWNGDIPSYFRGLYIWTDGDDIYYSDDVNHAQLILDKSTDTWNSITWNITIYDGDRIWTDGKNVYYSLYSEQYVLDKTNKTWNTKSWSGLTSFEGNNVWKYGNNIYYSRRNSQYILNKI